MADEEELELDVNQAKSSKKSLIIIVAVVLILNLAGVGAWLVLGSSDDKSKAAADDDKKEADLAPLIYLTMVPEFIVNFGPGSKVRYLQVDLQISTRDEASLKTVGTYRPVLRNDILVDLSGVRFDDLKNREGKEALQKKLLNTINRVVNSATRVAVEDDENTDNEHAKDEDIKGPIENVYFTSFIMQ